MKKKFINGLLIGALVVGFTSSMVSCKDYDDEKIVNLEGIVADNIDALEKALASQKADLEKQIKQLSDTLDKCRTNCLAFQTTITKKLDDYLLKVDFYKSMKELRDSMGNVYYNKTEIEAKFIDNDELKAALGKYYTKEEINDTITYLLKCIEDATTEEAISNKIISVLGKGPNGLTDAIDVVIAAYNKKNHIIDEDSIKTLLKDAIHTVNLRVDSVAAALTEVKTLAESANKLAADANGLAMRDSIEIVNVKAAITELEGTVKSLDERLTLAEKDAASALEKANTNYGLIVELQGQYKDLDKKVTDLAKTEDDHYKEVKGLIADNLKKINALEETVKANKEAADKLFKEIGESITTINENIGELQEKAKALKEEVDGINEIIKKIYNRFNNIAAKFISGIVINGTYNPMFGELALPFDIRSNMLVAFHGSTNDFGLQFPSTMQRYAAVPDQWEDNNIDAEDLLMFQLMGVNSLSQIPGYVKIGENEDFVAQQFVNEDGEIEVKEGNAGTLYLTVNPTDRDFTGTEFTLINSANVESPVQLSDLAKSDHVLTFGITRAAGPEEQSANGFYETKATVDIDGIENIGLRFDLESLKDVVKDLMKTDDAFSVTNLVNAIYNNVSDLLDATAVKATWTDSIGTKSVVSQYSLAVAGIKPFSYAFAKDYKKVGEVPGLSRVEDFVDNMIEFCFEAMPSLSFLDRFDVGDFKLIKLENGDNVLWATFDLKFDRHFLANGGDRWAVFEFPYFTIRGDNGKKITVKNTNPRVEVKFYDDEKWAHAQITLNIQDVLKKMSRFYNDIHPEPMENIEKIIKSFLDDVNKAVDEVFDLNFTNMQNKITDKIHSYFEKFNDKLSRFMNPNKIMQPVLLVETADGYRRLTESALCPTSGTGTILSLVPTTYNAEILSPAFKKFVAVTNVIKGAVSAKKGDLACQEVLKKVNEAEGLMKVIDGGFCNIEFVPEAGYTYEILYSAVDYSGLIATKKFYVYVK